MGLASCAVPVSECECSGWDWLAVQYLLVNVSAVGGIASCAVPVSECECSGWGWLAVQYLLVNVSAVGGAG